MEITHPYLRMAAGALLAAGLASACSGGSSGTAAQPMPDPDPAPMPMPMTTYTGLDGTPSEGCGADAPNLNCIITTRAADNTTTVRRIETDTTAMTRTETVTVSGSTRTITVMDTENMNRVMSVEMQTCTGGENCQRTSLAVTNYSGTSPVTTTTRYNAAGQVVSRMVGDAAATTTVYSSSGGGRTETTVTSAGRRVQTFNVYSGGTATSTVFTSTNGLVVTTMDGDNRVERTYASASDAMAGENPTLMRVGSPMENSDTGFAPGPLTRTTYDRTAVSRAGIRLPVEWTETVTLVSAGGTAPEPELTSRTYETRDAMGRVTERETRRVSNDEDGTRMRLVATTYPTASATEMRLSVATTTEYAADGTTPERTTVVTTMASGAVETVLRNGPINDDIVTTVVRTEASDGSVTVATTYGPGRASDDPDENTRVSVRTLGNGNIETTTSTPGASDDDPRVVSSVVTTDALGVEIMRQAFTTPNDVDTRTTTATTYGTDGTSTVTTTTATRGTGEDAEYENTRRVVVTRDVMRRETRRVAVSIDSDGDESGRQVTVTVYAADGSSEATRTYSGGMGDMLMDVNIVKRAAPTMSQTAAGEMGTITDDIVIHPGVQSHGRVNDEQYMAIQQGMAMRTGAKTVMSPALLHINYSGDTAFDTFVLSGNRPATGGMNVEMELITTRPACSGSSCTYNNLVGDPEPSHIPEVRIFRGDTNALVAPRNLALGGTGTEAGWEGDAYDGSGPFWNSLAQGADGFDNNMGTRRGPEGRAVLFQLLADLLNVGGAGVSATYTAPEDTRAGNTMSLADKSASDVAKIRATVAVGRTAATELERGTFTDLKTTGLPDGVTGIGRQVKRVDSYLRLGGTRAGDDGEVPVTVENYFGWMANSMFTVRRVTATGVTGYDWITGGNLAPGATDEVRAYIGMASGNPSTRPEQRRADGMTDPGTWTGSMIGVGSIQGERYRGRAQVSVNFDTNAVTTEFDQILLSRDFDADLTDANLERIQHVHPELRDGISFESAGITSDGSFTSSMLMDGAVMGEGVRRNNAPISPVSSLSGQFYGPDAAEAAGTFTAYGLALGKTGQEAMPGYRGDLVGAFGAARDAMEPEESN